MNEDGMKKKKYDKNKKQLRSKPNLNNHKKRIKMKQKS